MATWATFVLRLRERQGFVLEVRPVPQWEPELPVGLPRPRKWRERGRQREPPPPPRRRGHRGAPFGPWLLPLFLSIMIPASTAVRVVPAAAMLPTMLLYSLLTDSVTGGRKQILPLEKRLFIDISKKRPISDLEH